MSLYVARLDTSGLKHSRVVTPFSAICVADLDRFGAGMGWRAKPCDARRAATARTHLHLQAAAGPASAEGAERRGGRGGASHRASAQVRAGVASESWQAWALAAFPTRRGRSGRSP